MQNFKTYEEYSNATVSEKITLAHVHASTKIFNFQNHSGMVQKREVDFFVVAVKQLDLELIKVNSPEEVVSGTFYFDIPSSTLYIFSASPTTAASERVIITYRLFFSDAPISLSWDLGDDEAEVEYLPRLRSGPGFKTKIGRDQQGISITGNGTLKLQNADGFFQSIYDLFVFENKEVRIYSYNRSLLPSQAKILYRGLITDKRFSRTDLSLKIKDSTVRLKERVPLPLYGDSDNVLDSVKGRAKRRLYGINQNILLQSINPIGNGFNLTGTLDGAVGSNIITGNGSAFLSQCSPGDKLTIGNFDYTIKSVEDDQSLIISKSLIILVNQAIGLLKPKLPFNEFNRKHFVAHHPLQSPQTEVITALQANRLTVNDASQFVANDIILAGTETAEVKRISGNQIVLKRNLTFIPSPGTLVVKRAVQEVFLKDLQLRPDQFTINFELDGSTTISLDQHAERDVTLALSLNEQLSFTNGSRSVSIISDFDPTKVINPRDWIGEFETEMFEVLSVSKTEITLRTPFIGISGTKTPLIKEVDYVSDKSQVTVTCLGKTKDGTTTGDLIRTAPEVIRDLLEEAELLERINEETFTKASKDASFLISLALPLRPTSKNPPRLKSIIDALNETVIGSLVLDDNLDFAYNVLSVERDLSQIPILRDDDIFSWSVSSDSGDLFRNATGYYRFQDADPLTGDDTSSFVQHSSEFVEQLVGTNKTETFDLQLFEERDAQEVIQRLVIFNSLSQSEITLRGSINLARLNMGEVVLLDLKDHYSRLGDGESRLKVGVVSSINRDGEKATIKVNDLGNLFNRAGLITPDNAEVFTLATSLDRLNSTYITDDNGLVDSREDTQNTNLIT